MNKCHIWSIQRVVAELTCGLVYMVESTYLQFKNNQILLELFQDLHIGPKVGQGGDDIVK